VKNANDLSLYMDQQLWRDSTLLALANKVKTYGDPEATGDRNYAVKMEIKLSNGRVSQISQEFPRGCPLNPVGRNELRIKFQKLASAVLPTSRIEEVIEKSRPIRETQ
jgi:2-methylcitrate dehydratase PrpD